MWIFAAPLFAAQMLAGAWLAGGLAATTLVYGAVLPSDRRRC